MARMDKYQALERLTSLGWVEDDAAGPYRLRLSSDAARRIADALAGGTLHVYDAQDLQAIVDSIRPDAKVSPPPSPESP
jgi:hypothetical protein